MTDLVEQMYCSQQIVIPPALPSILKKYAKAAIRTQPRDLLLWSFYYFKAVSSGKLPPVKERIEYPPQETITGLTPGFLKVLINQIGNVKTIAKEIIEEKWQEICLEKDKVQILFKVGSFKQEVDWLKFIAVAAGSIEKNLLETMSLLCELLTEEPEGGSAMIPVETFLSLYKYLAALDCGPDNPFPSEKESENLKSMVSSAVQYSEIKQPPSKESIEDLMNEVGRRESEGTPPSRDSQAGLPVWTDISPEPVQEQPPADQEEFVTSATGLQVWDEDHLDQVVGEKKEVAPPERKTEEEVSKSTVEFEPEKAQETTETLDVSEIVTDSKITKAEEGEDELQGEEDIQEEGQQEEMEEEEFFGEQFEGESDLIAGETKEIEIEHIVEPDESIIMVPTPLESQQSLCSDERSVRNITESEEEPSVGQLLRPVASLEDVRVRVKKVCPDDMSDVSSEDGYYWIHLPGIGPVVPQSILDEVETFLRQCASSQCGMVMPRNLRHFLCPSLDGHVEEAYILSEENQSECQIQVNEDIQTAELMTADASHYVF